MPQASLKGLDECNISPCITILLILIGSRIGAHEEVDRSILFLLGPTALTASIAIFAYKLKSPAQSLSRHTEDKA